MTTWTARDWSQLGTDIALLAARAIEMSDGAFPPASDLLQQAARLVDVKAGEEALKELREGPRRHGHGGWSPELWVDGPGLGHVRRPHDPVDEGHVVTQLWPYLMCTGIGFVFGLCSGLGMRR